MITPTVTLNLAPNDTPRIGLSTAIGRRLLSLNGPDLIAAARRKTGLSEFGDPPVEQALAALATSLECEAQLHLLGRLLMRVHLKGLLETRLRLAAAWRRRSGILERRRIEKPLFIVGMPRSGSTFLHELIGELSGFRAPRVWEVMFPIKSAKPPREDTQERMRKTEFRLWWFRRLAPRADAVYPMRATTPHECVAIQSYTFLSEEFISSCHVPGYEKFLHSADLTPVYDWERRFLQHLQQSGPGVRWILKSPDHVYGLNELFAVFPDAIIIQTHRNPAEVLKSSADLTRVLRGLYGRVHDAEAIEDREARVLAEGTERFIQFRDAHPELAERFIDVKYTELSTDPLNTVQRICEQLGYPLTQPDTARIRRMAASRSRYRGPRASAVPANVRLHGAFEASRFESYCSRFGLANLGAQQ